MSKYLKYLHVIKLDSEDAEGMLDGTCYVFPKLDGTNGSVWADEDGNIHCGSRNRELSLESDNAGFMDYIVNSDECDAVFLREFVRNNVGLVVYGEWLCSTKFSKNYLNVRKFYVFDVVDVNFVDYENDNAHLGYLPYDVYSELMNGYPYMIEPLVVINSPSVEELVAVADNNHFNLPENVAGEGVVIKNYDFRSKWGNYEVGKIVRDEFKQNKQTKSPVVVGSFEREFVDTYVTSSFVQKCLDKVWGVTHLDSDVRLDKKTIGMTFAMVWKDAVEEEMYNFVKKHKKAVIDFDVLQKAVNEKVRSVLNL